ncbi:MAG: WYL domain-containing protein [Lachnospiraceae bacterium]|nr:WYL domain-containing protein [Lachnospiraceae bacterium]
MELFSEIYNCYFQIVDEICKAAATTPITEREMLALATNLGYGESGLTIVPKLTSGIWNLLSPAEGGYTSKIDNLEVLPLTTLQKRWLKSTLSDERMGLFLEEAQKGTLNHYLEGIEPLFLPEDFYYYDRFKDGDDFSSPEYISHFRTILKAIRNKQAVDIRFSSHKGNDVHHIYYPCRIEYSAKNDKFRLLAIYQRNPEKQRIETINLSRIESVSLIESFYDKDLNLEDVLKNSYYKEPVRLAITNKRNALERAMLHFANYEKQTIKTDKEHYECHIYYNSSMETELLIEILSFGPTIKVLGPDDFLNKIKERVQKQQNLLSTLS